MLRDKPLPSENPALEDALNEWAVCARNGVEHLAWPKRTLLGKLIDMGPAAAAIGGRAPVESWPDMAQKVEAAILRRLTKQEQQVIIVYAFCPYPREVNARYCQMSPSRYSHVLTQAKRSLADYLRL